MRQRVPNRAWYSPAGAVHRPRVLIEDDHPALAISDFSAFRDAGFEVAFCSGPGRETQTCPLLRGQECDVLARADVVLHGLDRRLGIAAAIKRRHPELAVVVEQHSTVGGDPEPVPDGCLPLVFPCSVHGQVEAVRQALVRRSPNS